MINKNYTYPEEYLNIGAICPITKALGPGRRFVIWLQGCLKNCYNCGSAEWKELKNSILIKPYDLAQQILDTNEIEGVTVSGGEPILQLRNLNILIGYLRREKRYLTIICYTGYLLEELVAGKDIEINEFLQKIDVLIDGPYVDDLNNNKGWRGSSNQRIHFLAGNYKDYENEFINKTRDIEIHLLKEHYLIVGIKPIDFVYNKARAAVSKRDFLS